MDPQNNLAEQIHAIEQLISRESGLYENASDKMESLASRLEILERIRVLQTQLQELRSNQKNTGNNTTKA